MIWACFHAYLPFIYLLGEVFVQIFYSFFNWIVYLLRVCYIFWVQILYQVCFVNLFFSFGLSFYFLNGIFWRAKVFHFKKVQFVTFFSYGSCLLGPILRNLYLTQGHKGFPCIFSRSFVVLALIFRSIIHFSEIFKDSVMK